MHRDAYNGWSGRTKTFVGTRYSIRADELTKISPIKRQKKTPSTGILGVLQ